MSTQDNPVQAGPPPNTKQNVELRVLQISGVPTSSKSKLWAKEYFVAVSWNGVRHQTKTAKMQGGVVQLGDTFNLTVTDNTSAVSFTLYRSHTVKKPTLAGFFSEPIGSLLSRAALNGPTSTITQPITPDGVFIDFAVQVELESSREEETQAAVQQAKVDLATLRAPDPSTSTNDARSPRVSFQGRLMKGIGIVRDLTEVVAELHPYAKAIHNTLFWIHDVSPSCFVGVVADIVISKLIVRFSWTKKLRPCSPHFAPLTRLRET